MHDDRNPRKTLPMSPYRTAPLATSAMPSGMPFIVGNEAAERFSFYGMRAFSPMSSTRP